MKRCLLLGRKALTNLDCILKSRDITLPTKVCLVKAMIFPAVTYGFEGPIVVLEKTLESPLDSKSVLKQINPEYSLEGLLLKLRAAELMLLN